MAAPLFQVIVTLCNRVDNVDDLCFQVPIIILMVTTSLQFGLSYLRLCTFYSSATYAATSLAFCWLTVIIDYLILASAMRGAEARREFSHHAIAARQAKHERTEIEAIAQKTGALYMLRHSLANQMRSIADLATAGEAERANTCLLELENQAHALTGGHDD